MEGVGAAASVIAVIELSANIVSVCLQQSHVVKKALKNVDQLQGELKSLQGVLENVKQLLGGPNGARLSASGELSEGIESCKSQLNTLDRRLSPSKSRKAMSRVGLRALKWPLETKEVDKVVRQLERCKQSISLALQVDQT